MGLKVTTGICVFCGDEVACGHHNCVCEACAAEREIERLEEIPEFHGGEKNG